METYRIQRIRGELDWGTIPVLEMNHAHNHVRLEDTPVRAWTQLAYNDEALFVHQWTVEPEIRAEYRGVLDEVCEDSCLELYLCPMEQDERYFNIEYNLNTARYLGFGRSIDTLVRLLPEEGNDGFQPRTRRTRDGWEIFYQIPFAFIRQFFPEFECRPGSAMRVNCCKCGNFTVQPHWLTWSPISVQPLTFHYPKQFGKMSFE